MTVHANVFLGFRIQPEGNGRLCDQIRLSEFISTRFRRSSGEVGAAAFALPLRVVSNDIK